jgi:4-hydroxy-3-polyprenylbenzoate decarboxylase
MLTVTENGAIVVPPAPAFYHQPKTDDVVTKPSGDALHLFDIDIGLVNGG